MQMLSGGNCWSLERISSQSELEPCTVLVWGQCKQPSSPRCSLNHALALKARASPLTYSSLSEVEWSDDNFGNVMAAGMLSEKKRGERVEGISKPTWVWSLKNLYWPKSPTKAGPSGCLHAITSHYHQVIYEGERYPAKPSTTWWAMNLKKINEWK